MTNGLFGAALGISTCITTLSSAGMLTIRDCAADPVNIMSHADHTAGHRGDSKRIRL